MAVTDDGPNLTPASKAALAACREFPDIATRTLARMLVEKRPKLFKTVEYARSVVRQHRGNMGDKCREQTKDRGVRRQNGKAGTKVHLPEPVVESWEPLLIEGPATVGVLSDIHVPYHDKLALETAVKEMKRRKCDVILLNGDTIDFHSISRFEHDPEKRDAVAEIRDAVQLMRWLRSQFPKARMIFKLGNHEERWERLIWQQAPVLWQLSQVRLDGVLGWQHCDQTDGHSVKLADYGWEYLTNKRPVMAGDLPILHGHEINASSPVSPARGAWLRTSHTVLIGHLHRTSQHTHSDMFHSEKATFSSGCLCTLTARFCPVNQWNHGACVIDVAADNEFNVSNFRISGGKIRAA